MWAYLSLSFSPSLMGDRFAQVPNNHKMTIEAHEPQYSTYGLWKAPEALSSGPEKIPLNSREDPFLSYGPHTARTRYVAYMVLYTIMHHVSSEIQWLIFQGPIMPFHNQFPKSTTLFQRKTSVSQSFNPWWLSEDHSRTSIIWPFRCWLAHFKSIPPRENWPEILKGKSQEFFNHQISCQGIKHSRIPWTAQLVYTGGIQVICMALAHLGQFIFHCGDSRHTDHFSRWKDLY
ncbi:hypothetical protein O181_086325 [Austropuccinia psidii MF-1]|uniref:Uncharacterized protein n=1 Tax=Austropuccinia psidii MF-1 TaxID=1389203 RepID=A0A9Q3IN88_9BASI|nr:hypothetical protein [Austropuccinia psidii MF-1]